MLDNFSLAAAACAGDRGEVIAVEPDGWTGQLYSEACATDRKCTDNGCPIAVAREVSLRSLSIAVRSALDQSGKQSRNSEHDSNP
jgi:hypothetical protein